MATEKYAIGAQAVGFVSFDGAILDVSTYSPTTHILNIPAGMINIGGQGKGYTVTAVNPYPFNPALSPGTYVVYANAPTDSSGIVTISDDSFSDYVAGGGDNDNRRAFCYFRVVKRVVDMVNVLEASSIQTFHSGAIGIPANPDNSAGDGHFTDEVFDKLKKMGFFLNSSTDFGFTYRGQYWDESVSFDSAVMDWDIVYKNIDGSYYPAINDDTLAERAVGIAELNRNGEDSEDNYVITSGIVTVGTAVLSDASFPAGTYIYLSETTAGLMVRDFDFWASTTYSVGDRIIGDILGAPPEDYYVFEVTVGGLSDASEPDWSTAASIGGEVDDNAVTWTNVAHHEPSFMNSARKIRVGISLGNGVMMLQPGALSGATLIDDHDESSYAHGDIQTALNKAGIYVQNISQGTTDFSYNGQMFDEFATFSGVSDGEELFVYKNSSSGDYEPGLANGGTEETIIGISKDVVGNAGKVVSSGFVSVDTTGSGLAVGSEIYLDLSIPGGWTDTATTTKVGVICQIGASGTGKTAGMILVDIDFQESVATDGLIKGTLGLTGYDVIVGSSSEVSGGFATNTIDDWLTGSLPVVAGDRVYILSNSTLPASQDVTVNDVKIYFDPEAAINSGTAGQTLTFSGDRIEVMYGRFTGFTGSGDEITISGAGCDFRVVEGSLDIFNLIDSEGGSIVRSTNSGIKTKNWSIDSATGDITTVGNISANSFLLDTVTITGSSPTYTMGIEDMLFVNREMAWNIDKAVFESITLDVSTEGSGPRAPEFNSDGTKMYVFSSDTASVFQYDLPTPWDISNALFDSVTLDLSTEDATPVRIFFKPDGLKMYMLGSTGNNIYQYTLAPAWDLSNATFDSVLLDISSEGANPSSIFFKPDGLKMYMLADTVLYQYTLSPAWDLANATFDSVLFNLNVADSNSPDIFFKSDGTKMYSLGILQNSVNQFILPIPWDISNALFDSITFSVDSEDGSPRGVSFNSPGTKMYIGGASDNSIYQYSIDDDLIVTLPPVAAGEVKNIKRLSATEDFTIQGESGTTIDGAANVIAVAQYQTISLISDGTDWFLI